MFVYQRVYVVPLPNILRDDLWSLFTRWCCEFWTLLSSSQFATLPSPSSLRSEHIHCKPWFPRVSMTQKWSKISDASEAINLFLVFCPWKIQGNLGCSHVFFCQKTSSPAGSVGETNPIRSRLRSIVSSIAFEARKVEPSMVGWNLGNHREHHTENHRENYINANFDGKS